MNSSLILNAMVVKIKGWLVNTNLIQMDVYMCVCVRAYVFSDIYEAFG